MGETRQANNYVIGIDESDSRLTDVNAGVKITAGNESLQHQLQPGDKAHKLCCSQTDTTLCRTVQLVSFNHVASAICLSAAGSRHICLLPATVPIIIERAQ